MSDDEFYFDLEERDLSKGGDSKLDPLSNVLSEAVALESTIEQLEEDLSIAKTALHKIKFDVLPDMMDELEMPELNFRDWKVSIKQVVAGSLPKKQELHDKAINWLVEHDAASIITSELSLKFARSQHNEAASLAAKLEGDGHAPSLATKVHPQTLLSFVRERLKNGEEVDTETLGVYVARQAQMKKVKK